MFIGDAPKNDSAALLTVEKNLTSPTNTSWMFWNGTIWIVDPSIRVTGEEIETTNPVV